MLIRPSAASDLAAVAALVNGAYRGTSAAAGWTHEAELLDGQRTDPASLAATVGAGATILVARNTEGGPLVGCVSLEPKLSEPRTWYIGMLTVAPSLQSAGLGSALLEAAEAHAGDAGAGRLEMTVIDARASLIAWYRRRGYAQTGETRPFPYDDERFGRPRRPDLAFTVLAKVLQ